MADKSKVDGPPTVVIAGGSGNGGARPRVSTIRQAPRARIRVKFRSGLKPGAQKVIGGHLIRAANANDEGWVETNHEGQPLLVYADEVKRIREEIEDSDALGHARASYERKLCDWIVKYTGVDRDRLSLDRATWSQDIANAERHFTGSIEAELHALLGRSPKLFAAVDVVETDLPPPRTEQEQIVASMIQQLGIGRLNGGAPPPAPVDSSELVAETVAATIQALTEKGWRPPEAPAPAEPPPAEPAPPKGKGASSKG